MTTTPSVPSVTLTQGVADASRPVAIPQVGFGTWQVDPAVAQRTVEQAIDIGYRHIDTAAGYYNEAEVGAGLRASGVAREDLFVTTKLRNGDQGFEPALRAFDDSRRALGVDVVDLYLIHWPVPSKDLYVETWRAFEKLLADGAVRAIGVSNFLPDHLERLLSETDVPPAVDQIELHPTLQQRDVVVACQATGIAVEAYSPLGQGRDLALPAVSGIAAELGVTPGQVVLRWQLQQGNIIIPKTVSPDRMRENLDLFGFELGPDQVAAIDSLNGTTRLTADPETASFTQFRR